MRKSEILVSTTPEPDNVFTNTRLRVVCTRNNSQQSLISFVAEWRRQSQQLEQIIHNHDNVSYECSPLDLECSIEVKIKYDDGGLQTATRRFGPVRMEPEMVALVEKQVTSELFPIKTLVDNTVIELSLILTADQMILRTIDQLEYAFRLDNLPFPELMRLDGHMVSFRLKSFSEPVSKFMVSILRKPLKYRLDVLDIALQSTSKRNYLLFRLLKTVKRKANSSMFLNQADRKRGILPFSDLQEVRSRNNSYTSSLSLPRGNKALTPQKRITALIQKQDRSKSKCKVENDILKDIESRDLFGDMDTGSNQQAALNLRDSFVELESKQYIVPSNNNNNNNNNSNSNININSNHNTYSNTANQQLKESIINDDQNRQMKGQVEQARSHIKFLNEEIRKLRKENTTLRQTSANHTSQSDLKSSTTSSSHPSDVSKMLQKIEYLTTENRRLESERTQIIADKISTEVKYKKEKQEKELLKRELDTFKAAQQQPQNYKYDMQKLTSSQHSSKNNLSPDKGGLSKSIRDETTIGAGNTLPLQIQIEPRTQNQDRLSPSLRRNTNAPPSPLLNSVRQLNPAQRQPAPRQ